MLCIENLIYVMAGIPEKVHIVDLTRIQLNSFHDSIIAIMIDTILDTV